MTTVIVRHQVKDLNAWKHVFLGMTEQRAKFGCKEERIYHGHEDKTFVVVRTEWGSAEQARNYFASPELKHGMQDAGVLTVPTVDILEATR